MSNIISGLPPIDPGRFQREIRPASPTTQVEQPGFFDTLTKTLDQAQQVQSEADKKVAGLVTGKAADVQSTMVAVEKADLSFQLVMQVRNKIVAAYQEISQMQF